MMAWKRVGDVESDSGIVVVEVDQDTGKIRVSSGKIMVRDDIMGLVFNAVSAAYLAVLLDEAIALAKGEGTKL